MQGTVKYVPFRTILTIISKARNDHRSVGLIKLPAALFTNESTLPNLSDAVFNNLFTWS